MEREKFLSVANFYLTHCILKQKERTGWISWNVSGRRESIAEHISSAQALAWALYSEFDELSEYNMALFDEFEAKETPEAQFAYLCDKLDCDLQAFFYSFEERCSIENATYKMVSNPNIQEIIKNGAQSVWDVFYEADKKIYKGTFLEDFFNCLKDVIYF